MLTQINPQQRLRISMPEIASFCQRWHIAELSLFGSALGDHKDNEKLMERKSWCSAVGDDRKPRASPYLWVGAIDLKGLYSLKAYKHQYI
jgi:hypothetical protein